MTNLNPELSQAEILSILHKEFNRIEAEVKDINAKMNLALKELDDIKFKIHTK